MGLPGMADKNNMPPFPGMPNAQSIMGQKPVFQQPEQTKRARTRITDDQLKVLRSNFDINNSPTEEQIHNMAGQTGLPQRLSSIGSEIHCSKRGKRTKTRLTISIIH